MGDDIRLAEHQVREVSLSAAEAALLRRELGHAVEVWPTSDPDHYTLKAGSHVGFATLPGGRTLVIEPKVPVETLFALLAAVYEPGKDVFRDEPQTYTTVTALFEFVVRIFAIQVEDLIACGLLHGYRSITEDLTTVRGRLRLAETLHCRPALHDRHICTYSRFTPDVDENRILRWTAFCLQVHRYREVALTGRLRRIGLALSDATLDPEARWLFEQMGFHRLNDPYRPALALARLLLDHLTFSGTSGGEPFLAYLVDMDWLFERYLGMVLKQAAVGWGLRVREQEHQPLDTASQVITRPDVIIYWQDRPVLVIDAKYKLAAAQSDLYQILAYCHILGLTTGVLVHPAHERAPAGALAIRGPGGIYLRYLALDLRGNPAQLQVQVRALAERVWSLLEEKTC